MNRSESKYFNTAALMDEALLQILENKDYEFITVKEICAKAGVNRSTFYLHYESIDDLLAEATEFVNKRFQDTFKGVIDISAAMNGEKRDALLLAPKYLLPYLEFIKNNKKIYRAVHKKPELFDSKKVFEKMYSDFFKPAMRKFGVSEADEPYVFDFYTKGTLAIIAKWVELDCAEPPEKIASLIYECVNTPFITP